MHPLNFINILSLSFPPKILLLPFFLCKFFNFIFKLYFFFFPAFQDSSLSIIPYSIIKSIVFHYLVQFPSDVNNTHNNCTYSSILISFNPFSFSTINYIIFFLVFWFSQEKREKPQTLSCYYNNHTNLTIVGFFNIRALQCIIQIVSR